MKHRLFLFLIGLLWAHQAAALSCAESNVEQSVASATMVVRATVEEKLKGAEPNSGLRRGEVFRIRVTENIKAAEANETLIVDRSTGWEPQLEIDRDYLLFLWKEDGRIKIQLCSPSTLLPTKQQVAQEPKLQGQIQLLYQTREAALKQGTLK